MATQSVRDKMREDEKQQFNIWLTKATATRLKLLSKRTGKAYPALIADALQALESALSGEPAEPKPAQSATGNLSELLPRLAVLESRLTALEAQPLINPSLEPNPAEMAVSVAVATSAPGNELPAQSADMSDTDFTPPSSSETKVIEPESAEPATAENVADKKYQRFSKEQLELREQRVIEMRQFEKNKSEIGRLLAKEGLGAKGGYEPLHAKEVSKILEKNNLN